MEDGRGGGGGGAVVDKSILKQPKLMIRRHSVHREMRYFTLSSPDGMRWEILNHFNVRKTDLNTK